MLLDSLLGELGQSLNCIGTDGAGVQSVDRQGGVAHKEYLAVKFFQILENFQEHYVLGHEYVVEGLDVLIAVLDGHAVAKAHALDLVIAEPDGALFPNEQALVDLGVGSGSEGGIL